MMKKSLLVSALLMSVTVIPATAQTNDAVAKAMFDQAGGRYTPPACSADKGKQFNVSSGYTYLKSAITGKQDPKPLLASANRVITEAIVTDGQDKAVSAWYGLGWVDLFQGDVAGADTALARAEKLGPDCKAEIDKLRRIAYTPIYNSGVTALQDGDTTGALQFLRQAEKVRPGSTYPSYFIGVIYADRGNNDSALAYFAKVASNTSTDSNDVKLRGRAAYAQAAILINSGKAAEAVPLLEKYVQANPGDADAKTALARAYRATGETAKAQALDAQTGSTTAAGPTANSELGEANKLYNAKDYAGALVLLNKVLAAEPTNVSALQAQANSYLGLKDGPQLTASAAKLAALEPFNQDALKLQRAGYQIQKMPKEANAVSEQILQMPIFIQVTELTLKAASATLGGTARGLPAMDAKTTKPIAPAPITVTFHMLDKSGTTVATQDVTFEPLAPDATKDFSFEAKGEGITSYKYVVKK
jgi:cytochrome c-type biogenesis protein CcmH/NrfG